MSQARVQQTRKALQADPTRAQAWADYIQALIEDGQADEARKTIALGQQKGLRGPLLKSLQARADLDKSAHPEPAHPTSLAKSRDTAALCNTKASQLRAQGRLADAEKLYRQALAIDPGLAAAHYNLAITLKDLGHADEAQARYERAVALQPQFFEAHFNLANLLREEGQAQRAVDHYRAALKIKPNFVPAHWNIGMALDHLGHLQEAERHYRLANATAESHYELGQVLYRQGKVAQALEKYQRTLLHDPTHVKALYERGAILLDLDRASEAEADFLAVIALRPDWADAHYGLGRALLELNRFPEAEKCLRRSLELKAGYFDALVSLAAALQCRFMHTEAEQALQAAIALKPRSEIAYQALLFNQNYQPDKDAREIYAAYMAYDQLVRDRLAGLHTSVTTPYEDRSNHSLNEGRRLRIGYVSPDLRLHSVGHFLEPLLAHHDHSRFEVFAYAELAAEDAATARYRGYCDHFVLTRGMTDEALAARIRADAIDVLVDPAGHTTGNRLMVFARKPAPVSLSWMGYGYTTGLKAIDYFLIDEASAPAGSEHLFSERPWRLPCAYAYRPGEGMGEVSALPAMSSGRVTFGTLTRSIRINHRTIRVWSQILKHVPKSVLVIDSRNFQHASMQDAMAERFAEHGIGREQLQIGCHSPPWDTLRAMDIALDCFPHNSGTTLFESLYMGVPFITLAGRPSVGRLGRTVLTGLGRQEWLDAWCADSEEDYIVKAVALASDLPALAQIRQELRPTMQRSALMDEAGFTRNVEQAYAQMFGRWQASQMQEQPQ